MPRRWLYWGAALAVGIGAGVGIGISRESSPPAAAVAPVSSIPDATWPAGQKPAKDFALRDQRGAAVSLARFRGRPVIVTFIDPLCRNLCPTEAKILGDVAAQLPGPQRPAIVSVSVNKWGNARHVLQQDVAKWKLPPAWHWAVGSGRALEKVWKDWSIGVFDAPKTIVGVTVHQISHTEAAYVVDSTGHTRALFLYPFRASVVASLIRSLGGG